MVSSYEIRLGRFDRHLHDLRTAVEKHLASQPYLISREDDAEALTTAWAITLTEPVPPEIAATVGDSIHNLRSVLDNWVYELSVAQAGKPVSKTGFPILSEKANWNPGQCCRHDHGSNSVRKLPEPVQALIESYQPYNMDDTWKDHIRDDLRILHKLDIRDKHRALNLTATNVDFGYWTQPEGFGNRNAKYAFHGMLELNTPTRFLVLEAPTPEDFEVSVKPYPVLEVIVTESETQRWEEAGEEVISLLQHLYNSVSWVLGSARQIMETPSLPIEPSAD